MSPAAPLDLGPVEEFLEERLGLSRASLHLGADLEAVLRERVRARGCADLDAYRRELDRPEFARQELHVLAGQLTVGETYFFREWSQIEACIDVAMPERFAARPDGDPITVLSAGCASGEEAYSLAIALQGAYPGLVPNRIRVVGVDVNPLGIQRALRGRYSEWTLRAVPDDVRKRCFVRAGEDVGLRREIAGLVDFKVKNLLEDDPAFWRPGAFDVIFCRNVLMYLAPQKMVELLERFAGALAPRGFLFLASSESLRATSAAFDVAHTHGVFYYRRSAVPTAPARRVPGDAARPRAWVSSIHEASARVAEVAQRVSPSPRPGATRAPGEARKAGAGRPLGPAELAAIERALLLIGGERFADAMTALAALPPEAASDARVELLRAVILCQQGDLSRAERACRNALDAGDDGAAHYVLGLCQEQAGDTAGAAQHYKAAARRDPSFAMPHLRLGMLARRAGDMKTTRDELARASELLVAEQHERLVLFGGGFPRATLIGLCQAELRTQGGRG
ncbi:chemotaxis protein CheR [Sorangium cellulosum]|uniref:Chemotaxis protein CheR n=1 Tax=Sorangium cellulosum TaxID=56 RepID=A0A2L0ETW0_SORCE|nr:chemotaxis protein CheR [Sorangium cellulosum]